MKDLCGRTAFITGAASGIGLGVATRLSQAGMKIMLCDIDPAGVQEAVAALHSAGGEVAGFVADVSIKADLKAAADATIARFGKVHVVHNNAGVIDEGGYGVWTDRGWDWSIGINLMGVVWGVEIFGPLIESHGDGGHIVNTASIAGLFAFRSGAYRATKYGVVAFSEGLRFELAPLGIGVSVLCPGFVRTDISKSLERLPDRFAVPRPIVKPSSDPTVNDAAGERVLTGLDPLYVGELVRDGILGDWAYIFTDTEFEHEIEARFAGIKAGFDQIRDRSPSEIEADSDEMIVDQ